MLDISLFETIYRNCYKRVKYELGAKAPSLNCDTSKIREIDCSGYVRYCMARLGVEIPDGSQNQRAWFAAQGFKHSTYNAGGAGREDGLLRVAFASPKPGDAWPRHVWFVLNGRTIESYGGVGVGSRKWDDSKLKSIVSACFVIT